ncbi:MAG: 50S ribosomal protein L14 [Candidatus Altiarchaeota archaeon]|nr:50S ribosomal protein L14 [Candidatus Altiarchaeota archaeon]
MIGISSKVTKTLPVGAQLVCADNTGARIFEIITVAGFKGRRRTVPVAGIGDLIIGSAKKGVPEIQHQVLKAVIIRQRKEFRRADGTRVKFSDNACILVDEEGKPKGTEIKGPVAKEVLERWNKIGSNAKIVV